MSANPSLALNYEYCITDSEFVKGSNLKIFRDSHNLNYLTLLPRALSILLFATIDFTTSIVFSVLSTI